MGIFSEGGGSSHQFIEQFFLVVVRGLGLDDGQVFLERAHAQPLLHGGLVELFLGVASHEGV